VCEISVCHGGKCEDDCFWSSRLHSTTFQKTAIFVIVFFPIRIMALMMEPVNTSETSVNLYETTWSKIPVGLHLHTHRSENMKSHVLHKAL
jgi:hypothetical protein